MNIALAHDWLNQMGGAENVLEVMVKIFPNAPVLTTIYAPDLMPANYRQWQIITSWLNRAPGIHRHHQPYLPFYPAAVRSLDFSGYDLILSNKSGFIHGLNKQAGQTHLCYCLAPTRYVWEYDHYANRESLGRVVNIALGPLVKALQRWDFEAAQRVDQFCAISTDIQNRIKRYYQRDSTIIYPPVDTDRFQPVNNPQADYYYMLSRLIPYKRIDLAIEAFNRMGKRLIISGDGRDRAGLEAMAGPTIEFTGRLPWDEVAALMANCKAFIFPGYEDFGITPVEAQAAGRPVIAYAAGGALDTVRDGETGVFFRQQTPDALIDAVARLENQTFDPEQARAHAQTFSIPRFTTQLQAWIAQNA